MAKKKTNPLTIRSIPFVYLGDLLDGLPLASDWLNDMTSSADFSWGECTYPIFYSMITASRLNTFIDAYSDGCKRPVLRQLKLLQKRIATLPIGMLVDTEH